MKENQNCIYVLKINISLWMRKFPKMEPEPPTCEWRYLISCIYICLSPPVWYKGVTLDISDYSACVWMSRPFVFLTTHTPPWRIRYKPPCGLGERATPASLFFLSSSLSISHLPPPPAPPLPHPSSLCSDEPEWECRGGGTPGSGVPPSSGWAAVVHWAVWH